MKDTKIVLAHKTSEDFLSYEVVKLSDWKHATGERALSHSFLMDSFRKLMGRTLTIIDASTTGTQNKAMKDLIRATFSEEMGFAADWAFDQVEIQKLIPQDIDPAKLGTVSIEDALGVKN